MEECEDLLRFLIPAFLAKDKGLLFNFTVLITWLIALSECLAEATSGEKGFFWLTVREEVHLSGEGMVAGA